MLHHYLLENFHYDPDTGQWTRLKQHSSSGHVGPVAGTKVNGYLRVMINQRTYPLHRLAWFYVNGQWPPQVDHEDGDRLNNKFCNLRYATARENKQNMGAQANNRSGYKGVSFHKSVGKFRATHTYNHKRIHIGYFNTAKEAHEAYCAATKKLHGGFFNAG